MNWKLKKKGKRLYLAKIEINLPKHAVTKVELSLLAKKLKIPKFRGVFMRDTLPPKIRKIECGIINLDISASSGTHWIAYAKKGTRVLYYDSYENLKPPKEFALNVYSHTLNH